MDFLTGQKKIAETLGNRFKQNSLVSDVHYVRDSTGMWWFTVWYRGNIKPVAVEQDWTKSSEKVRIQFSFQFTVNYMEDQNGFKPKRMLPMDLTPNTGFEELPDDYGEENEDDKEEDEAFEIPSYADDIDEELSKPVPGYSRPPNINPDTKKEEAEYIYNDDGLPIAPANGKLEPPRSYSRGKRGMVQNMLAKKWGQGAITVSIEHWLSQEQYTLNQIVYDFISDFIKQYDSDMTSKGQRFMRDVQKSIMQHDKPDERNFIRMVVPLAEKYFTDDTVFADSREFAEGFAYALNQRLIEHNLFAPVFYMHHAIKDFRILMQPGDQKDMIKAMNIYSKVLCHMNG